MGTSRKFIRVGHNEIKHQIEGTLKKVQLKNVQRYILIPGGERQVMASH